MKFTRLAWMFLMGLFTTTTVHLLAQQADADRNVFEAIKIKAEQGDAGWQCALGECYGNNLCGVIKDMAQAVKWYRKAATQGHAEAQFNLGCCYHEGNGVTRDKIEAVKWYRKAAEQGFVVAQFNLGSCYYNGEGVVSNVLEAVEWLRKAAEQGNEHAQFNLGVMFSNGEQVERNSAEAAKWYRKAAEQGNARAELTVGVYCHNGEGLNKDLIEAAKWFRKAANQGDAEAQFNLGCCYRDGDGVVRDAVEAAKWFRNAAEQGNATAQGVLAASYLIGNGTPQDYVEAYKWSNLAAAQGLTNAATVRDQLLQFMTPEQIAQAQQLTREFKPRKSANSSESSLSSGFAAIQPVASGTGFFISDDGFFITCGHVVKGASQVRLVTSAGLISARVVKVDAANDLALLKAEGRFAALPIAASRTMNLGGTVATVGFPNIGLQGFAPKFARGEIASLSGAGDDARYFQISVPVQPGNSGGALVDERGNVVGVVSAKLNAAAALKSSGALPENVNYAVKSSYLLSFLESVPEVSAKLKDSNTKEIKFEQVVEQAKQAAVLVLVY